jgi:hypothetical protein
VDKTAIAIVIKIAYTIYLLKPNIDVPPGVFSMEVRVVSIEDQEDGSALVVFDMDEEAKDAFIRAGIMSALIKGLEQAEKFKGETQ